MRYVARLRPLTALVLLAVGAGMGIGPADASPPKKAPPPGRDRTAPAITCPSGITTDAIAPIGAPVRWSATATDDSDPAPVVLSSPASGSKFPVGTTTVRVTATDASGNRSTKTFDVTVRPMSGPVAYREYWRDANGGIWFEWDITVAPDGTVSGSGRQTQLIAIYGDENGAYPYALGVPPPADGVGTMSGFIAADGYGEFVSSRNFWYRVEDQTDESGNPIVYEERGGSSRAVMTSSFWGNDVLFWGNPLEAPWFDDYVGTTLWIKQ